jgi:hypothetical protein
LHVAFLLPTFKKTGLVAYPVKSSLNLRRQTHPFYWKLHAFDFAFTKEHTPPPATLNNHPVTPRRCLNGSLLLVLQLNQTKRLSWRFSLSLYSRERERETCREIQWAHSRFHTPPSPNSLPILLYRDKLHSEITYTKPRCLKLATKLKLWNWLQRPEMNRVCSEIHDRAEFQDSMSSIYQFLRFSS